MSTKTSIEWTESSWNPVRGCTRVSPGCGGPGNHGGCYAEAMAARFSEPGMWGHGYAEMRGGKPRWTGKVELQDQMLDLPLTWKKPRRIFVNSTSDLFHESLPDEAIDKVFAVMALCPQHTFQVLTKRAERMQEYFAQRINGDPWAEAADAIADIAGIEDYPVVLEPRDIPLPNVWLGTSCEDQQRANERIIHLLRTPAAIRFLSCEPLIGSLDLRDIRFMDEDAEIKLNALTGEAVVLNSDSASAYTDENDGNTKLNWVICGGESGPQARPMHDSWARSLRDQCAASGTPFFMKQMSKRALIPEDLMIREWPNGTP